MSQNEIIETIKDIGREFMKVLHIKELLDYIERKL